MSSTQRGPDEERAYRDGLVDAALAGQAVTLERHTEHLSVINGQIAKAAADIATVSVETRASSVKLDVVSRQLETVAAQMPKLETVAEKAATAELVEKALEEKRHADRSRWERWRNTVAWSLGILVAFVTMANLSGRLLGIPRKTPVNVSTVTVQDLTPVPYSGP